ncbi:MAG TPA: DUF4956 domain-containing protein [Longimicrobiaceae bacterium]
MEVITAGSPATAPESAASPGAIPAPEAPPPEAPKSRRSLRAPLAKLLAYYALSALLFGLLIVNVPQAQRALVSPLPFSSLVVGASAAQPAVPVEGVTTSTGLLGALAQRSLTLLLLLFSCVLPVAPVTAVYMLTKRLRYDPSLVQSMILLPIVVAGILLVVQNSIAVAFGLVGIVAAVRFRNTLEDPKDAAYIFLALGVGLAAGVQSLDVAMGMSFVFNVVVLTLWRLNIGSIYRGRYGRTGIFTMGRKQLWIGQEFETSKALRGKLEEQAEEMDSDGILLIHSPAADAGRRVVEECLAEEARDWALIDVIPRGEGFSTLEYLVRLKRRSTPAELLAELDERSPVEVASAEYIPYHSDG